MNEIPILRRAEEYATAAHAGQFRTDGQPFIKHPRDTANLLSTITDDVNLIAAGYLHDTIEDCGITYEMLVDEFNEDIADLVQAVTNNGKKNTFPGLEKNRRAVVLKFADRLSNLSDMNEWNKKRKATYIQSSKFWKG